MLQHCLEDNSTFESHSTRRIEINISSLKRSPYSRMLINGQKCIIIIQRFSELSPRMISVSVNL